MGSVYCKRNLSGNGLGIRNDYIVTQIAFIVNYLGLLKKIEMNINIIIGIII